MQEMIVTGDISHHSNYLGDAVLSTLEVSLLDDMTCFDYSVVTAVVLSCYSESTGRIVQIFILDQSAKFNRCRLIEVFPDHPAYNVILSKFIEEQEGNNESSQV